MSATSPNASECVFIKCNIAECERVLLSLKKHSLEFGDVEP
jgi:hypothetical protein